MNNDKYLYISISNNNFYICEREGEQKESPSSILKKIETIVKNNLPYDKERHDRFSQKDIREIYAFLSLKAKEIVAATSQKQEKLICLAKLFFRMGPLLKSEERIRHLVFPPEGLKMVHDLMPTLSDYLTLSDINALSGVNRKAREQGSLALLSVARGAGYGGRDISQAKEYLLALFQEIEKAPLPIRFVVKNKKGRIDGPKTFDLLRSMKSSDLLFIILNDIKKIRAFENCPKLLSFFMNWPVTKGEKVGQGVSALYLACKYSLKQVALLLLSHGVDPNLKIEYESSILSKAVDAKDPSIVQLLLDKGAKIDFFAVAFSLGGYARNSNTEIFKLLLSRVDNINQQNAEGDTFLHIAARSGKQEHVELLLQKGADPHIRNHEGIKAQDLMKKKDS